MKGNIIEIMPNTQEWLDFRLNTIGASEISCLFNLNSYKPKLELWYEKAGKVANSFNGNIMSRAGLFLEDFIANEFVREVGVEVEKANHIVTSATIKGMSATPDFYIVENGKRTGVLEIKNVCAEAYEYLWIDDNPPISYQLQMQYQLACTGLKKGTVCAFIGGRELKIVHYVYDEEVISRMEKAVVEFWESVEANRPPEADADRKVYSVLRKAYPVKKDSMIDMTGNKKLDSSCEAFIKAKENKKLQEDFYAEKRNIIKQMIKENQEVVSDNHIIKQHANGIIKVSAI